METPSTVGRITRSRAKAASTPSASSADAGKVLKSVSNSMRKKERAALKDLTNESPVSGLAESMAKSIHPTTPCANLSPHSPASHATPVGEDILRSQVQSLLQKISADGSKPPVVKHLLQITDFVSSPSNLLAPTPANTPTGWPCFTTESSSVSGEMVPISPIPQEIESILASTHEQEQKGEVVECGSLSCVESATQGLAHEEKVPQIITQTTSEEPVGRSLVFESPILQNSAKEKPKSSSPEASFSTIRELEDDEASDWSLMVNVSSPQEVKTKPAACDEELNPALWEQRSNSSSQYEETREEDYNSNAEEQEQSEDYSSCENDDYEEYGAEEGEEVCDELCQGVGNMNISDRKGGELRGLPAFAGKHIRFNYTSDGEMEEEEEEISSANSAARVRSPGVLKLKGLPTPKGKHLRFKEMPLP